MSQTLADDSEVIFDQPEESAGAIEPEGSSRNRHKKETWLEGTEPHRGARPRTMDLNMNEYEFPHETWKNYSRKTGF